MEKLEFKFSSARLQTDACAMTLHKSKKFILNHRTHVTSGKKNKGKKGRFPSTFHEKNQKSVGKKLS